MRNIFILLFMLPCLSFGQKDSSLYCNQYSKAIDYIRQDTFVKSAFHVIEYGFKVSDELIKGGIDPDFYEEFLYLIFKKPIDSISKAQIDSAFVELRNDNIPNFSIYKINCPKSDIKYNLKISFSRENDTIIGASIYLIHKASFYKRAKKSERKGAMTFEIGAHYLFFFNKSDNIVNVFKKTSPDPI